MCAEESARLDLEMQAINKEIEQVLRIEEQEN